MSDFAAVVYLVPQYLAGVLLYMPSENTHHYNRGSIDITYLNCDVGEARPVMAGGLPAVESFSFRRLWSRSNGNGENGGTKSR
jgi:hypothetical protein